MPMELTNVDLSHAKSLLDSAGPSAMYDYLSQKGYQYATLANGVAKGDSVAGEVAIGFMKSASSDAGHIMSENDVNRIRGDMADKYIMALRAKLDDNGVVSSDITHNEAWDFHRVVFNENGLSVDAWTLNHLISPP